MYHLRLNLRIEQAERSGGYSNGLEISDSINVNATSFMEIAQVLGKFHELAILINAGHSDAVSIEVKQPYDNDPNN